MTLPEGWDRPLALCLQSHMARQLVLGSREAAAKDTADLNGTGQVIHPKKEL